MAGMAVDGLVSGFNTTQMISQLMTLEAGPQTLLKGKVAKAETVVSALQSLNTKLSSLQAAAAKAASATSWQAVTATSSAPSVTATVAAGAPPSSFTFKVDALATRQTSVTSGAATLATFFDDDVPTNLTLVKGAGTSATYTNIDLAGVTDFASFAAAVNKADAGVTVTLVSVNGATRVQVTGKDTGAAAGFDLYRGTQTAATPPAKLQAAVIVGRTDAADAKGIPGSTVVTTAANASITLWSDSATSRTAVTSPTNTFDGIVSGMSFTVSAKEAADVTVRVSRDDAALKKLGSDLVTNVSTVLSEVDSRTKATTTTTSDGRRVVTGGVLSADSATRQVRQSVVSAVSMPVAVQGPSGSALVSPATVGVVLAKDGTVSFDEARFSAAMAADPARTQKVLAELAARVEKAAKGLSDPATGSLSLKIQGQQSYMKNLSEQVDGWDTRLALRRTTLERTYSSLEVSLSNINAQASWLTSQLESLNASSR